MTAYHKLYPKFESYPEAVRQAKRLKGLTIDALVESAGVSYSSVSRLCDGTQLDPKLYNSVALCKVLGLSMDEIFGLSASEASAEELQAKLHAAELGNAHLAEENKRLHEVNRLRAEQLLAVLRRAGVLLVLCRVKCRTHRKRQNKVQRRCQNKALRYAVQPEKSRQNSICAE